MTTNTLKKAFKAAEQLPASEQDQLARAVMAKIGKVQRRFSQAFTRLSETGFEADWDNEKDAAYDNWQEHYGT